MLKPSILILFAIFVVASTAPSNNCTTEESKAKSASCLEHFETTSKNISAWARNATARNKEGLAFMNKFCDSHQKCWDHFQNCQPDQFKTTNMQFHMKATNGICMKTKFISLDWFYECGKKIEGPIEMNCEQMSFLDLLATRDDEESCQKLSRRIKCMDTVVQEQCGNEQSKDFEVYYNDLREYYQCAPEDDTQKN